MALAGFGTRLRFALSADTLRCVFLGAWVFLSLESATALPCVAHYHAVLRCGVVGNRGSALFLDALIREG